MSRAGDTHSPQLPVHLSWLSDKQVPGVKLGGGNCGDLDDEGPGSWPNGSPGLRAKETEVITVTTPGCAYLHGVCPHLCLFTFSPQYTLLPVHFVPTTFRPRCRVRVQRPFHLDTLHRVQMVSRAPEPRHLVSPDNGTHGAGNARPPKIATFTGNMPAGCKDPVGKHTHDQLWQLCCLF